MIRISTSTLAKSIFSLMLFSSTLSQAQEQDSLKTKKNNQDPSDMNMDAAVNKPFLTGDKSPVTLGGYIEANSIYSTEEGVSDGLSFQARRLSLFMSANIAKRISFMTELEIEDGGEEMSIEFAAVDVALDPLLNFRGGIVMNPIGAFNQNHDGPKWEFVERPDIAVNMLAATLSNAGFGAFGKTYSGKWIFGYETYITNGFDNTIISNEEDKTYLPNAKENPERFMENHSGKATFTGKLSIKNRNLGEIGISYMGGAYNKTEDDGEEIEDKARLDVFALDFNTTIKATNTTIIGEAAWTWIDMPSTYTEQYGEKQFGAFVDVVQPLYQSKVLEWENASLNFAARFDYVDWNIGKFDETGTKIGDERIAVTPALSFRPTPGTVFRINYRYQWDTDVMNNPAENTATWYFGFSTYF